jgi:hypothetical protein
LNKSIAINGAKEAGIWSPGAEKNLKSMSALASISKNLQYLMCKHFYKNVQTANTSLSLYIIHIFQT